MTIHVGNYETMSDLKKKTMGISILLVGIKKKKKAL